jgi:ring-1,2-phenylacetyl-CoA epoxidase subunit PaaC
MTMTTTDRSSHFNYILRHADTALLLGHRLSEWLGNAPTIEEELALANMSLDLIGQAQAFYVHAAKIEDAGRDADQLAYLRDVSDFINVLLVEIPNGDLATTMVRQLFYATFGHLHFDQIKQSVDNEFAGIAARAEKEFAYHKRHAGEWLIRLGDGTDESHERAQAALDHLWMYTGELFSIDDVDRAVISAGIGVDPQKIKPDWDAAINEVLAEATLVRPRDGWMISGGRDGLHSEHLGHLLAEMQHLQRVHPGAQW